MLDENITLKPLSERKQMQVEAGATTLPLQDLCYCTWTSASGEKLIVDIVGHDESESIALLSYLDEQSGKGRAIWVAKRDQAGRPGTWLWTTEQLEAARKNPVRISDSENEFKDDQANRTKVEIAPLAKDRRTEILILGQILRKSDEEVRAQLRAEGLDDSLPVNYRGKTAESAGKTTEPLMTAVEKRPEQRGMLKRSTRFSRKKHR